MISVIIPNYNGLALLKQFLPENLKVFEAAGVTEVIVVDDCGQDESLSWLKQHYPQVKTVKNESNLGFSKTCNRGAALAENDVLFFLNNDIQITRFNIKDILNYFKDETLFSVVASIVRHETGVFESLTHGTFAGGFFEERLLDPEKYSDIEGMKVLWSCGAAAFVDRKKFEALGGFQEAYSPYYFEDSDLGIRAWRRGWKNIHSHHCLCNHLHQSTIKKSADRKKIQRIQCRNRYLFHYLNIGNIGLRAHFYLAALLQVITLKIPDCFAIGHIISHYSELRKIRRVEATLEKKSMKEVLRELEKDSDQRRLTTGG